jgi:hypothetical protein
MRRHIVASGRYDRRVFATRSPAVGGARRGLRGDGGDGSFVVAVALGGFAALAVFFFFLKLESEGEVVIFLLGAAEGAG